MTSVIIAVVVVYLGADGHARPIRGHRYRIPGLVVRSLAVDVAANLGPIGKEFNQDLSKADSAALKSAVDNCLRAVPSGLDCCKPKSEGGGGADCGAGGHAAIGDWDTSKVTDMNRLFCDCANGNGWCGGVKINRALFNQPIGKWDTSKVTDMNRMFHGQAWNGGTSAFNQPIGDWDVSKVTNMQMFTYTRRSINRSADGTPRRSPTCITCSKTRRRSTRISVAGNLRLDRYVPGYVLRADAYNAAMAEAEAKAKV
jgi:hypothetical protein